MRTRRRPRRAAGRVRRVVVVVPSLFTLANLFFGFWSMVLAAQGSYYLASWWIIIAGILDVLDGLSARISRTDSRFGAELDSLVDLVSFGIAPAVLMYYVVFAELGGFAWVFSYAFAVGVALRLARYNTATQPRKARGFTGLPSTAAGMTLAAYYPFTQTDFYQFQLAALNWPRGIIMLIIVLTMAMVSSVEYARLPRIGIRTKRGLVGLAVNLTVLWFGIFNRDIFFFPLGIAYVTYGFARAVTVAFLERGDDEDEMDLVTADGSESAGVVGQLPRRRSGPDNL